MTCFPVQMPVIYVFCLISLARTSSPVLNKSVESRHPCIVPNLRGNAFSFPRFSVLLAAGSSSMAFIVFFHTQFVKRYVFFHTQFFKSYVFFHTQFVKSFYYEEMLNLMNAFSASIKIIQFCPYVHMLNHLVFISLDHDIFSVLLNSVCQYFVQHFCIYVHK